jgi:hypothetical protein
MYGLAAFLFLTGVVFLTNYRTDVGSLRTFDILITALFAGAGLFFLAMARKAGANSR